VLVVFKDAFLSGGRVKAMLLITVASIPGIAIVGVTWIATWGLTVKAPSNFDPMRALVEFIFLAPLWGVLYSDRYYGATWAVLTILTCIVCRRADPVGRSSLTSGVIFFSLVAMLLLMPDAAAGGSAISMRLAALAYIAFVIYLSTLLKDTGHTRYLVALAALLYVSTFIVSHWRLLQTLSQQSSEVVAAQQGLPEKNSILYVCFDHVGDGTTDATYGMIITQPMLHTGLYGDTDEKLLEWNNAEAGLHYFPIQFRGGRSLYRWIGSQANIEADPQTFNVANAASSPIGLPRYILEWGAGKYGTELPVEWFQSYRLAPSLSNASSARLLALKQY
jgi:hypothetical protein